MDIEIVMKNLYASEINCSITSFWDNGWDVKLGDTMNGFRAERTVDTLDEAATFLDREARRHYPDSLYTLGPIERARRQAEAPGFLLPSLRPLPAPPRCRGIPIGDGNYTGCSYGYGDIPPFTGPLDCPTCNGSGVEP